MFLLTNINILINIQVISRVAKVVAIIEKIYQNSPLAKSNCLIYSEYFSIAVELIAKGKVNEAYTGVKLNLKILNIAI